MWVGVEGKNIRGPFGKRETNIQNGCQKEPGLPEKERACSKK